MRRCKVKDFRFHIVVIPPVITFLQSVLDVGRVLYAMDYPYQYEPDGVIATDSVPISNSDKKKLFKTNAEKVFAL